MKFMLMHRHHDSTDEGWVPPGEFVAAMGQMVGGLAQSGKLVDGDGLGARRTRSRVTFEGGQRSVTHGPYEGRNEVPAGFVKVTVRSRDEAIDAATRIGEAIGGDVELEVGKLTEAWDLGFGEKPADAPERYLIVHKATPATEAGRAPDLTSVLDGLAAEGILTGSAALAPSSQARRLTWKGGAHAVVDGPFAESKELIGGFVVLELDSMDECLAITHEYAALMLSVYDRLELDIRPL
ncbi:MAG: YciI family protein [Myxococcota bacterium]